MQGDQEDAAAADLRCACGYSIHCRVRSGGKGVGFLVFFDGEPTSETHGKRVWRCPGCGEQLVLPTLLRSTGLS